jgi:hypothetical protein
MKTLSVFALSVIVGLSVSPRVDAAAQSNQTRDRSRGDQVCVYKDINYQGPEQCYGAGDVRDLGATRKSISSIRVYGRATVTVYENTDFRGRSLQFTSDVADLGRQMMAGNTAWSDHIDSLRITAIPERLMTAAAGTGQETIRYVSTKTLTIKVRSSAMVPARSAISEQYGRASPRSESMDAQRSQFTKTNGFPRPFSYNSRPTSRIWGGR